MKHFYFFTNRVRKSFRGLVLAALVVLGASSAFADTYTIEFKDNGTGSDGTAAKTAIADVISSGSSYVTSLTDPTKVFQAKTGYGIKLGSSSANGYLTLVLSESGGVKPTSVTVNAARYSSDTGTLNVKLNGTAQTAQTVSSTSFNDFTFTMDGATKLSSIYIGTSAKRMYIKSVTVTYTTASTPTITVSPSSLSGFTYVQGSGPSATKTFTVSGANLTANISLAAPTNYEISLSSGSGYAASLTLTQSGGTVSSTTIYARLKSGLSTGTYNSQTITASSSGATNQTVTCSGSVTAPVPTITVTPTTLSGFTYVQGSGPSTAQTFTVSGANLTANISLSAPTNYEISLSSGSGYTTSLTLTQSGGTVSSTTIYARLKSGLSTGTYNSENITATSTGATNQTVSCSGSVTAPVPTITVTPTTLSGFTYVQGSGPSTAQTFTVSGANLTANISLSAPTNYEISLSSGSGYTTSLTLTQSGGTVSSTTIYARLKSGLSTGTYNSENVVASSTDATSQNVTCSGSVTVPPYTVTFNAGTGSCGTASLTEASGGAGVTLPTASPSAGCAAEDPAWVFAGWATASQTETTSAPTLYAANATYKPSANVTLYAVYKQTTDGGTTDVTESYGFETGDSGWTVAVASQSTTDVHSGTYSGSINADGAAVKYNTKVADPKSFTFWFKKASTNNNYKAYIEVSSDGSSWTTVGTYEMTEFSNTEWRSKTADLSSYSDVYVRFSYYGTTAVRYVDDVSVTHTVASSTTTYNSNPNCVECDANTLALTSTTQTINIDSTGYADYDVSELITSKNGNGAVTYSVTPAAAIIDENTGEFTTDTPGTYYVSVIQALGSGGTPICGKTVKDTIVVLATPTVTIVDVTPLTFTANCGEASAAQSVKVSGYNLTANMTATAPTNFTVSSDGTTYGATATFTQASGTASGTLYIKANPPAASTNSISGNVSLTSTDATTRTLAVSATVSCTPVHIYFNDKGSVIADSTEYVGGTVTFPANPSCTDANYTFDGWCTATLNDAASYTKVTAPYTVTGETTLYAVYRKLTTGGGSSTYTGTVTSETWNATASNAGTLNSVSWQAAGSGGGYAGYDATKGHQFGSAAKPFTSLSLTATSFTGSISQVEVSTSGASGITGTVSVSVGGTTYSPATATLTDANTAYTFTGSSTGNVVISWANSSSKAIYLKTIKVTYSADVYKYTTSPLCCPNQLATPTNFAASAADTQVGLTWDSVANASTYNIECTTNPAMSVTGVTGTSTTITGLTNCTTYSFKITAMGDNSTYCQSVASTAVTATPQSAGLTATFNAGTNGTCGTASLTNTCSSNDITLPSATPNVGFAFDGWQVNGTGNVYLGGSTFTLSANVAFVAKYHVLATYAISFINEGVEVDSLVQIVTEGSAGTEPVETMLSSCSEYLFQGWSTTQISGKSATAPTYYNFATAVTGPVTLYAVYSFVDTSTGGSNDYTLVTDKADLTAGSKVIIGSGAYVMGAQASNNRPGLTTGATTWTKTGSTITLATGSTAAILTVGVDGSNYTFAVDGGYLFAASSSKNLLKTQTTLDNNGKWALGAIDGAGKCASVVATGSNTRKTMAMNTNLFSCYSAQSSYGYMYFYKNTAAAEYTTNPICSPMIVVDQTDVESSIDSTDFVIGLGGTATSTGHTVFAKNCTSASYVQPVIFGVDKAVFGVNWTRVYLDNGAMDTLYTVSYSPVTGTSHKAFLYFETNDHTVISDTIPLYGEVCTAVVFGSQSATENTITINWTAPSPDSELRVWNNLTVDDPCESAPQPYDSTFVLGAETTRTITGLKASATYYYQATSGTCISEKRTIVTPAASGVPALTASSSTIEFIREIGKDTTQSVSLSGVYMNNASVSVAITGAGAAAFSTNASITLDGTGKGTLNVTYHPTSSQTFVAVATITYTSGCETKTVVVNLVGNVPGIDMVEINGDATGFVIHTDFQGTPDIVLSQEVEHAGTGKVANDLFFSKYYEAYAQVKLMGIYNGTTDSIPLKDIRIVQKKAYKATDPKVVNGTYNRAWSSATAAEVVAFSNAFWTNYKIPPRTEMILFTSVNDATTMNCVKEGLGFNHDYWFPVGPNAATYTSTPNYFGSSTFSFGGDKSIALQRKRADGSWQFIDLVGAGDTIYAIGDSTKTITANGLNDDPGWYCPDGTNYKTKEAAPLSTNRHLLIRKNTVVDGLNAVSQNKVDMETLCAEWEGLNVPTKPDSLQAVIACEHFSQVAEFNYDGYYSSFERVNEDLVTFTQVGATAPGDWVGTFANPTTTFQDTLRCYNLQISVLRYYDMRTPATPVELTKAEVQSYQTDALSGDPTAQAIIAALDTVEAASTQWRVPIIVKNSATVYTDDVNLFRDLSVDTCKTCDVVILSGGTLIKTTKTVNDRDSVRSVIVYNGGRLIVPNGLNYVVNDLQVRAKGDSVGAAYIEGNLNMKNPRIIHDKRIENDKYYFFTLPYDCPISKITQMNGKTMGPYGATWVIKYYDGAQRITNGGKVSNWKPLDAGATLKAGMGYVIGISSDVYKYVRFPMVANATFTEKNTAKTMDVTQYGHAQAYGTNGTDGTLGWNNVGWNLVGNPYVSYFMAQGDADSIMTGTTILKGRYLPNGGYNENTWKLDDTGNVYITVPDALADGGYLQKRVSLTQLDPFISFFVQADRTGSLNFATSSREQVAKVMRAPVVDYNEVVLNFDVAGKSDRTTIILDKERNTSYEIGQDLLKWKGKWGKTPYLYSFDNANNPLAFNAINYDDAKGSVPVAFYMPTSYARYTFSVDRNASLLQGIEHVYLLRNGSVIADLLTTNYTATDLKLKAENKEFAISIQRAAEVVTPVNPTEDDALMPRAITERHQVRVEQLPAEGTVMVMDAVGRTIATRTLTGADNMTFELPVDGVYTITVMTPARNYTLKTVIR